MVDIKIAPEGTGGYKSFTTPKIYKCDHCKKEFEIIPGEIIYQVKIPIKNSRFKKTKNFCSYTCKQRYIKKKLDPSENYC